MLINGLLQEKDLIGIKSHVLELVQVLLEETTVESYKLCRSISHDISVGLILDTMMELWVLNSSTHA